MIEDEGDDNIVDIFKGHPQAMQSHFVKSYDCPIAEDIEISRPTNRLRPTKCVAKIFFSQSPSCMHKS